RPVLRAYSAPAPPAALAEPRLGERPRAAPGAPGTTFRLWLVRPSFRLVQGLLMRARNILVINCGSSSIKFALVNEAQSAFSLSGIAERLDSPEAVLRWQQDGRKESLPIPGADHRESLTRLLPLVQEVGGELHGIGHRVVHGGEHFTQASRIDAEVLEAIRQTAPLAPLHNPANLLGIEAALKLFPELPQVAVF